MPALALGGGGGAGARRRGRSWRSAAGEERRRDILDGVRKAIKMAGAFLLYLPPYSPDLNPIEQAFAARRVVEGHAVGMD